MPYKLSLTTPYMAMRPPFPLTVNHQALASHNVTLFNTNAAFDKKNPPFKTYEAHLKVLRQGTEVFRFDQVSDSFRLASGKIQLRTDNYLDLLLIYGGAFFGSASCQRASGRG